MAKLLTITGPNGSGKSTIAEKLTVLLNTKYRHFDKVKTLEEGKKQYFDFLKTVNQNESYILDRFYEGEDIYAPLYRNYQMNYLNEIEHEIVKDHNFMFAYITADLQTIIDRIDVRGEDYVKPEHFATERKLFDEFITKQKMPFIKVDTTTAPVEESLARIQRAMKTVDTIWEQIRICTLNKCNGVISPTPLPRGNVEAKYMIVGQNPGGRGKGSQYQTAWSEGKASNFLNDILVQAGIYLDCWFTNLVLCSTNDNKINNHQMEVCSVNLKKQLEMINPEKVFALGSTTAVYLKQNFSEYEIIEVAHPSYMQRFYSKNEQKMSEYINTFRMGE